MVSTVSVSAAEMRRPKACNSSLLFFIVSKGGNYMAQETYYCEKCNKTMLAD